MNKKILLSITAVIASIVVLCGCTALTSNNGGVDLSKFIGSWTGYMEMQMFGGFRENMSSPIITELEFTEDTLYMTMTVNNETNIIPNSYSIEGNQIILSFESNGERPTGRSDSDGSKQPPVNGEPPFDRGDRPFGRGRSYTYSFNEDNTTLYFEGCPFYKMV